jgi:CheY-like chemotaxis protein
MAGLTGTIVEVLRKSKIFAPRRPLLLIYSPLFGMSDVRFLVADANPSVQKFFQQLIIGYGFEADSIKTASTPRAALNLASEHAPHMLLSDCYADGELSAFDLHREALAHNPDCRLALISAQVNDTLTQQAQQANALFYLAKPFTAAEVKQAMSNALAQLGKQHPAIAKIMQSPAAAAGQTVAATTRRPVLPALPKFKAGDAVLYLGRYDTVKNVILRQGELVVSLLGTPGMVLASKLTKL